MNATLVYKGLCSL